MLTNESKISHIISKKQLSDKNTSDIVKEILQKNGISISNYYFSNKITNDYMKLSLYDIKLLETDFLNFDDMCEVENVYNDYNAKKEDFRIDFFREILNINSKLKYKMSVYEYMLRSFNEFKSKVNNVIMLEQLAKDNTVDINNLNNVSLVINRNLEYISNKLDKNIKKLKIMVAKTDTIISYYQSKQFYLHTELEYDNIKSIINGMIVNSITEFNDDFEDIYLQNSLFKKEIFDFI